MQNNTKPVFQLLRQLLSSHEFALELLEDYEQDFHSGQLKPERLMGFVHGLHASGVISAEDWCDLSCSIAWGIR